MEIALKPLMYTTTDGNEVEIKNATDLKNAVSKDFDPSKLLDEVHLGENYADAVQTKFADATAVKGEPFLDEKFLRLITKIKPDVEYFNMTQGDRYLYLSRVHELNYDIVEEVKIRKQREHEEALEQARQDRDAGRVSQKNLQEP